MSHIDDAEMADDRIIVAHSPSSSIEQALLTVVLNTTTNTGGQQSTANHQANTNLLDTFSRVTILVGKYPGENILRNYTAFQSWMYTHTNKHAPIDICQSLTRFILASTYNCDQDILFNVSLICAEAYQTVGCSDQAYLEFDVAQDIASSLNQIRRVMNLHDINERDRKRKKLDEIKMKLEFQLNFKQNLIARRINERYDSTDNTFLQQLNMNDSTPEECRSIWRKLVLQSALNPEIVIPGAQWLLSYADQFPVDTVSHANSLYVALNLFLFGYGAKIFHERSDLNVFELLDTIGRYFEENGHQSKQFSSVHKMAHVWGTAAVAYHLADDKHKHLVCASIIRVSFERLGVSFLSSGIESLYILAQKHNRDFFMMMKYDPHVKLMSPDCIDYLRRKLNDNDTFPRYSSDTVDQLVREVFNLDQTAYRI